MNISIAIFVRNACSHFVSSARPFVRSGMDYSPRPPVTHPILGPTYLTYLIAALRSAEDPHVKILCPYKVIPLANKIVKVVHTHKVGSFAGIKRQGNIGPRSV